MSEKTTGKFALGEEINYNGHQGNITACYGLKHEYDYRIAYVDKYGNPNSRDVLENEIKKIT